MRPAPDRLSDMLTRLKLTGIRDQLDGLLDEASRQELNLRETLVLLCEREIARKDERRIEMTLKLARFPFVRDLSSFDFAAQPSLDPKQVRELAGARWIANGENVLLLAWARQNRSFPFSNHGTYKVPTEEHRQQLRENLMPQQQVPGYVRCDAVHIGTEWTFEVLSEQERVAYLTIETDDGPIHVGLNREEATRLQRKVQLFLQDWPEGQSAF